MSSDKPKCSAKVWSPLHRRYRDCSCSASVVRDGKSYCKRHDPLAVEEKRKKLDEEWKNKWKQQRQTFALNSAAPDLLEIVESWLPAAEAMGWGTEKAKSVIARVKGGQQP